MRILYISILGVITGSSGVVKKVIEQIKQMNLQGIKTKGIIFYSNNTNAYINNNKNIQFIKNDDHINKTKIIKIPLLNKLYEKINLLINRKKLFEQIGNILINEQFDFIYFRYPVSDMYLLKFVKKFPQKIIFEYQSKIPQELSLQKKGISIYSKLDLIFAPFVLKYVAACVGVTHEISLFEKERSKNKNLIIRTISNGFNVTSVPLRNTPIFDYKNINLLFVANMNIWHGVERILKGIAMYSGKYDVKLFIVGGGDILKEYRKISKNLGIENKVFFLGEMYGDNLNKVFDECHVAIGSLGLHKIKLYEACILKVREYLSRGMPFVISYDDTDLKDNEEISQYYLKVTANDEPININEICEFVNRIYTINNFSRQIRDLAKKYIDVQKKVSDLKNLLYDLN